VLKSQNDPRVLASQMPKALLLCGKKSSPDDPNLAKLLDFFGIPWIALGVGEITTALPSSGNRGQFCILSSASCLAEAVGSHAVLPAWITDADSVYLYGFQDTEEHKALLRFLTGDPEANLGRLKAQQAAMSITADFPEMCGPMSGMQVPAQVSEDGVVFDIAPGDTVRSIIAANEALAFLEVTCKGARFYLSACAEALDVGSFSSMYFDVKKHFCQAVPITMYVRSAFRNIWWSCPETSGCLIVDDPPLKPRYGFLEFREALELMEKHNFSTTVAFIPWNCRRTNSRTVDLFQQRPDRLSICVHGSDHTGGELAIRSTPRLNCIIKTAEQRMKLLHQRTALDHSRVMVFPQGAFSPETGRALKLNGFLAAVNTEVAPCNGAKNETTIADLWDVAIMKYGTFPIYTRRYLNHGIENMAFDGLLGKPCFLVAHHDVFREHGRDLVEFIAQLNALKWNLRWRPLGEAIRYSYKAQHQGDASSVVQMFAEQLILENSSGEPRDILFVKEESDGDCVRAVTVNQTPVAFRYEGNYLAWDAKLRPRELADVRIAYSNNLDLVPTNNKLGYRTKAALRRYLSEVRDNYLSRSEMLSWGASKAKTLIRNRAASRTHS
jgi:hypothetical protein